MLQLVLLFSLRRSGLSQRIKGWCGSSLNIKVQSYKFSFFLFFFLFLFFFFAFFFFFFEKGVTTFQHMYDIYHKTVAKT
ncbi:hypothetical protein ACB092_05G211300 [Castanea dentata]